MPLCRFPVANLNYKRIPYLYVIDLPKDEDIATIQSSNINLWFLFDVFIELF